VLLVAAVSFYGPKVKANTCRARPVSVHGVVHGVVFDPNGRRVSNIELQLHRLSVVVARSHTNVHGEFVFDFSSVSKGEYQLTTTASDFLNGIGIVKVTGWRPRVRHRLLTVQLTRYACGGGLWWGHQPQERIESKQDAQAD
jgi:hypothetical protein